MPKASEVLIEAKKLFGRYGQKWTRFAERRPGLCGINYCSIGALREVDNGWIGEDYLKRAIHEKDGHMNIAFFNDDGRKRDYSTTAGKLLFLARSLNPIARLLRWRQVKKVWCRAIEMAVEEEEKSCSQSSSS